MSESEQPSATDQSRIEKDKLIVVGIGASAGGVQALVHFFENVQEGPDIAYVVILHLSPDHDSKLAQLLQAVTPLTVKQVTETTAVRSGFVYVIPPNKHLLMSDHSINVSANVEIEDRRAPVDIFFRTLAETHGSRAIAVVLSGTGANGSMGLKRVKELGGAAFVQNPREAEYNEMPRNSIATELVDDVLPVADIPAKIIAYRDGLSKVHIVSGVEPQLENQHEELRDIFAQLRLRTGHDFTNYKRATLLRRIERRISVKNLPDLNSYANYLQQNPEETTALLKDFLISVTNFFRDKDAFVAIERDVIPAIIKNKTPQEPLRLWVAGCATGEEAYSLAMICAEQTLNILDAPKVQIFATDIDEAAIAQAREGLYTINDAADVSPERLRRFFNKEGEEYRVRSEIREMILFANHNFIKDPPFSHVDMVSCRNVLIYLNSTAQARVMEIFHFALNAGGYLFLGSAESTDGSSELYTSYSRDYHIFKKRQAPFVRSYPVPESVPSFNYKSFNNNNTSLQILSQQKQKSAPITFGDLHQRLLEIYAPPSVIINEEYEILHLSDRAGRYLQLSGGEPSQNLLKLVREELRLELRSALYQAVQRQMPFETKVVEMTIENKTENVRMQVRPAMNVDDNGPQGYILVLFDVAVGDEAPTVLSSDEPMARQLEEELIRVKAQLRISNQQHEFNAEELKASNEELQAMNEELRSAAEELVTSKEELQSINEELRTVNQELKIKVDEMTLTSNNLQNLINSVGIATIFLDRSFRVSFFTPTACELFNLIPADLGRPLSDITGRLEYEPLMADIETVLEKLQPMEREVRTNQSRVYVMRILPYRTAEDRINGVVMTFFDVSSQKLVEEKLRTSEARIRLLLESAKDYAIYTIDTDRRISTWNSGAEAMVGFSENEILGKSGDILFTSEDRELALPAQEVEKALAQGYVESERWHLRKDGSTFYGSGMVRPLYDRNNILQGFVKILRDLTETKSEEERKYFLASVIESSEDAIFTLNFDLVITSWNKGAEAIFKREASQVIGLPISKDILPVEIISAVIRDTLAIQKNEKTVLYAFTLRGDASHIDLELSCHPVKAGQDRIIGVSVIARDISERKKAEDNFKALADLVPDLLWSNDGDGKAIWFNQRWYDYTGQSPEQAAKRGWLRAIHPDDREQIENEFAKAIRGGATLRQEYRICHAASGTYQWFLSQAEPLFDESGKITRWFGASTNIHDIKLAEETIRQSEETLRITLESAEMGVWDWDIESNRIHWNQQHYRMLGLPPSESEQTVEFFMQHVNTEDASLVEQRLKKGMEEGAVFQAEFRIIRADNKKTRWMSGYGRTIARGKEGHAKRMVGVMYDITRRKTLELQKDEFIAIASHELRTPTTSIKAYAEILQERFGKSKETENVALMQKLNKQIDRLDTLIKDLLDTTKIDEGRLVLTLESFALNDLIGEQVEELQRLSVNHKIIFRKGQLSNITADRERIGQVVTNLITNAIRYSPKGGEIVIASLQAGDNINITVADQGIGIPEELKEKVFDRFFRVTTPVMGTFPGMGLGLYISAGIIRRHGGTMSVDSILDKGSVFSFTLPLRPEPQQIDKIK
jgi:two-component system, chemotaxis family, CheB/CheR fusion protein